MVQFNNTVLKRFPGSDSCIMYLLFSHLLRLPFFVILRKYPSFQFIGTCYSSEVFLTRLCNIFVIASVSDLIVSCLSVFGPIVFQSPIFLMALGIISAVSRVSSTRRSVCASSIYVAIIGLDPYERSSRRSTHLF